MSVRGRLGEMVCCAFPGLQARPAGEDTALAGALADPAALYGVLAQLEICPVASGRTTARTTTTPTTFAVVQMGALSLAVARANFRTMGACDELCAHFVRPPLPAERAEPRSA